MISDTYPDLGTLKRYPGMGHPDILYMKLYVYAIMAIIKFCITVIITFPDLGTLTFLSYEGYWN